MDVVAAGNGYGRDRDVLQAVSPVALLAIEMDMKVIVLVVVMGVAEFVADDIAGIVEHVHDFSTPPMALHEMTEGRHVRKDSD